MYLYGDGGDDTLSIDFGVTGTTSYYDGVSYNYIEMHGGTGNDNLHFGFNFTDMYASGNNNRNEVS